MTALTIFLAKLIGLFAILVSLSMVVHKRVMVETTTALLRNGPLLLITGMVGLVAGPCDSARPQHLVGRRATSGCYALWMDYSSP